MAGEENVLTVTGKDKGASSAGGIAEGLTGLISTAVNVYETEKNRSWEEKMSGTAHQREVKDLKKAGLNPILSATGGSGASTPSGSTTNIGNPLQGLGKTVLDYRQAKAERNLISSQIRNNNQDTKTKEAIEKANLNSALESASRTALNGQQLNVAQAQIANLMAEANRSSAQTKSIKYGLAKQAAESQVYNTWYGKMALPFIGETAKAIGNVFSGSVSGKF